MSSKIEHDKYYTPVTLANYCWDKVNEIVGIENISEIIEPSYGNGSFYHHPTYIPHIGYDIEPECAFPNAIRGDYLAQAIKYSPGRLIIGNPPYGNRLNLARKFFKKSVEISDYIAFILPISQLNNNNSMYEFDLIHSEDLGLHCYSGCNLHCCFNIYRRPINGKLNKKLSTDLKDVSIYRQDIKGYSDIKFDIRMCYWGNTTVGKILNDDETYSAEYKIKINNSDLKEKVIDVLRTFPWKERVMGISMKTLPKPQID